MDASGICAIHPPDAALPAPGDLQPNPEGRAAPPGVSAPYIPPRTHSVIPETHLLTMATHLSEAFTRCVSVRPSAARHSPCSVAMSDANRLGSSVCASAARWAGSSAVYKSPPAIKGAGAPLTPPPHHPRPERSTFFGRCTRDAHSRSRGDVDAGAEPDEKR
jgi:hypothetical protein